MELPIWTIILLIITAIIIASIIEIMLIEGITKYVTQSEYERIKAENERR